MDNLEELNSHELMAIYTSKPKKNKKFNPRFPWREILWK